MPFTTLDHLGKWKSGMKGETMLRFNGPEVAGNRLAAGRILPVPHPHVYICHKFVLWQICSQLTHIIPPIKT